MRRKKMSAFRLSRSTRVLLIPYFLMVLGIGCILEVDRLRFSAEPPPNTPTVATNLAPAAAQAHAVSSLSSEAL
jgi:hypothetical protein